MQYLYDTISHAISYCNIGTACHMQYRIAVACPGDIYCNIPGSSIPGRRARARNRRFLLPAVPRAL